MMLTRMFEADDFFLFHYPIIEKSEKKSTLFYKVYLILWISKIFIWRGGVEHILIKIFSKNLCILSYVHQEKDSLS
jgi:hypothetical protein